MTNREAELAREQDVARRAYDSARAKIASYRGAAVQGANQRSAQQIRGERLAFASEIEEALSTDQVFVLGRVDLTGDVADHIEQDRLYIARCGAAGVVNWKADAAHLFFESNMEAPDGVTRKRTFQGRGPDLSGFHDQVYREELADASSGSAAADDDRDTAAPQPAPARPSHRSSRKTPAPTSGPGPVSPSRPGRRRRAAAGQDSQRAASGPAGSEPDSWGDPLLEELERGSSSVMRDIVRTIQAEQYRLMTLPLEQNLVIQGGPGTGKTAVGLHRVALQLYRQRDRLAPESVLVVGPSETFLRYVASVLPSLGERGVTHLSLTSIGPRPRRILTEDRHAVRQVKGSARMAEVLRAFLESRISLPQEDLQVGQDLRLNVEAATRVVREARSRASTYADGRTAVRDGWIAELSRTHRLSVRDVTNRLDSNFERDLNRTWPSVTAVEAVSGLLSGARLLTTAAQDVLRPEEIALILRQRTPRLEDVPWTADDVPLLDEAEAQINGGPAPSFAHVVVDEAQNVTPMQWRMLTRRARNGTFTILGDLAQSTGAPEQLTWDERLAETGVGDLQVETLSAGYRTPDPVLHWANRLLWSMNVDLPHVRSVRRDEDPPFICRIDDPAELAERTVEAASVQPTSRRVGIIAVPVMLDAIEAVLHAQELPAAHVGRDGPSGIVLATPDAAHGLEFDELVVVEPALIVEASTRGLQELYVALTRTRGSLTVVHHLPLPPVLRPERLEDEAVPGPVHLA